MGFFNKITQLRFARHKLEEKSDLIFSQKKTFFFRALFLYTDDNGTNESLFLCT